MCNTGVVELISVERLIAYPAKVSMVLNGRVEIAHFHIFIKVI
jgi:hypothetical protein